MKKVTFEELKNLWFKFYESKGYVKISGASLIPENDASVLFTIAGMHPLVPYLQGEKHPKGKYLCNVQRCIRTNDIESVGDDTHCTFFEMLGNWTLGECDKAKMIQHSFEFLTSEEYLGIDKDSLAVSVFEGDETAPKDTEAYEAWKSCGLRDDQIFYLPKKHNWWALGGGVGPCGPDTEMFIDRGYPKCSPECSPACDCGKYVEIWNDVFMQYNVSTMGGKVEKLENPNIDTGMGLERTACILNGVKSVYDTGAFKKVIDFIAENAVEGYGEDETVTRSYRIIADHLRAATMIIGDGVVPSNTEQGYILRRLIRRSVNCARKINLNTDLFADISKIFIDAFCDEYSELEKNRQKIYDELKKEVSKFETTVALGYKEFEKVITHIPTNVISGKTAFRLYDTFGYPIELTVEMAQERGFEVDMEGYKKAFAEHQEKSRIGGEKTFKGGLADNSEQSAFLHTATHLLLATLRKKFGDHIFQRGSNITPERLRLDFNFDRKITPEELAEIEQEINEIIKMAIPVEMCEMSADEAHESGAMGIFDNKYGDVVKVYTIGNVSKEICGGPHASNTADLKNFKILKEESSSSGVRRIKAIVNF